MQRSINILAAIAAIATLSIAVLMVYTYPANIELPNGYYTSVLAFEFSQTEADLDFLRGAENQHREAMISGQILDRYFPYAYGALLALSLLMLFNKGSKLALPGVAFALIAIPLDFAENRALDEILESLATAEPGASMLPALMLTTWLKWGAIATAIGFAGIAMYQLSFKKSAILGIVTALTALGCYLSGTISLIAEAMAVMVSLFFLSLCVFTARELLNQLNTA